VWIPGLGSTSTWRFAAQHNHSYCMLSFFGSQVGKRIMDGFWEFSDAEGLDRNPYRAGFAQMVCVAETDAAAEEKFARHIKYFFDKCLHIPDHWWGMPGYQDYESLSRGFRSGTTMKMLEVISNFKKFSYQEFVDRDIVIAGSPATVRDKLVDAVKDLRIGNLMVLQQIGSMPHELTKESIGLFCTEVLPKLRDIWDDEGWENHWWPQRLRNQRLA
jgi:alkanesulfonate monooxygenase SsuD/methylene tetrahydromethanopterin reductase-like flavin-dependent oxidoreductase (luciferase family)